MSLTPEDKEKLREALASRKGPAKPTKPSESRCEECGSKITKTESVGEAGHRRDCPRRETHYTGLGGSTGFQNGRLNKEEGSA